MQTILSVLEYHGIDVPPAGARQPFLYVRPDQFRRQMKLLRMMGIRGCSVTEALRHLDEKRPGRVVGITFDDAYRDILVNALPVLRSCGFTATCYAVSDRLNSYNTWDSAELNVQKPTMSANDLLVWSEAGMEVGAHTRSHARLADCTDAQIEDEVAGSRHALEKILQARVTQFCYPWGSYDARVVNGVRAAGFSAAVTIRRGRARITDERLTLPRVPVHGNRGTAVFPFRTLTRYADKRL